MTAVPVYLVLPPGALVWVVVAFVAFLVWGAWQVIKEVRDSKRPLRYVNGKWVHETPKLRARLDAENAAWAAEYQRTHEWHPGLGHWVKRRD
jgi:hypothetical protein